MKANLRGMATSSYISTAEVAADLDVSQMTVTRWIAAGLLPASKFGRLWRVERTDFEAFKAAAKAQA